MLHLQASWSWRCWQHNGHEQIAVEWWGSHYNHPWSHQVDGFLQCRPSCPSPIRLTGRWIPPTQRAWSFLPTWLDIHCWPLVARHVKYPHPPSPILREPIECGVHRTPNYHGPLCCLDREGVAAMVYLAHPSCTNHKGREWIIISCLLPAIPCYQLNSNYQQPPTTQTTHINTNNNNSHYSI